MRFGDLSRRINESTEALAGFIDSILQNPMDTDNYLILADYLDEHNDPELAESLRLALQRHNQNDDNDNVYERLREADNYLFAHFWDQGYQVTWTAVRSLRGEDVGHELIIRNHEIRDHNKPVDPRTLPVNAQRAIIFAFSKRISVARRSTIEINAIHRARGTEGKTVISYPENNFAARYYALMLDHLMTNLMVNIRLRSQRSQQQLDHFLSEIEMLIKMRKDTRVDDQTHFQTWREQLQLRVRQARICSAWPQFCQRLSSVFETLLGPGDNEFD